MVSQQIQNGENKVNKREVKKDIMKIKRGS